MKTAIKNGDRELVKWVQARSHKIEEQCSFLQLAVETGDTAMGQLFFDQGGRFDNEDAFDLVAMSESLEMAQWVSTHCKTVTASHAMGTAAFHGHLDIVQWLHANRTQDTWRRNAMDLAAGRGHFDILQWLHMNRSEGCTAAALENAAENGHLDIIKWFHANRTGDTEYEWMKAARNCHLDVVVWLTENGPLDYKPVR